MGIFSKASKEPEIIRILGKELKCNVCENNYFHKSSVLLNSVLKSVLDLGWLDRKADCYTCSNCGHILWFRQKKKQ